MTIAEEKGRNGCSTQLPFHQVFPPHQLPSTCIFSRESSLPSSSPSLALFVNYPGGAVPRQLDRSNLEITRPIPSPKLAALNTRTQCRISPPRPRCVCVRTTKCLKNTDFPSRAHLNTRAVKMCQMSPEFGFLTLPSGECEYTLRENHGREVVLIYFCCFIVLLSVGMIDQIP